MRNKNSKMILIAMLLLGALTTNTFAESYYRNVKFFYVNGMNTSLYDAKEEMSILKSKFNGYNPKLIYSQTAGSFIDAVTIINFQNAMRDCNNGGYKTKVIKSNCESKEYFKQQLINLTRNGENAAHIVSYSRGNILANVVMEEIDHHSDYFDTAGASMYLIGRVNISSPGRVKYGTKFTTKRVDQVIKKVSLVIKGAKGNLDSRISELIQVNYPSYMKYVGSDDWNNALFDGNTNGHSLGKAYLSRFGLKDKIVNQVVDDYFILRDKALLDTDNIPGERYWKIFFKLFA